MIDPKRCEGRRLHVEFDSGAILEGPAAVSDSGSVFVRLGAKPSFLALMIQADDGLRAMGVKTVRTMEDE